MIQDPMLRELFRTESDEHLQRLDEVLLQLEKTPQEPALLEEAFREAHSMKGATRMLGLSALQVLTHKLEDELNVARRGASQLDPGRIGTLLQQVAEIRLQVQQTVGEGAPAVSRQTPAPAPATTPVGVPVSTPATAPAAAAVSAPVAPARAPEAVVPPLQVDTVRVDTRKLDELLTHSGELVVMRTRVKRRLTDIDALLDDIIRAAQTSSADQAANLAQFEKSLRRIRRAHADDSDRLERLSSALDGAVRQVRLLPLAQVFRPFARMVHDLAREQGKEIALHTEGEETTVDKRMLEGLKDPLMHMLRNAIAHGIEPPAQRVAAGKPGCGCIRLQASQQAGKVVITLSDDGRGLDLAAIRATALRRGLASPQELAAMDHDQLHRLILAPGFSTNDFVTDIAGRGVGMDVVRANLEQLKGWLAIESVAAGGTTFTLTLPATLATLQLLLVEVRGLCFGLPIDVVVASQTLAPSGIFSVQGRPTVLHRGTPVPVLQLAEVLELQGSPQTAPAAATDGSLICVFLQLGQQTFGVFVDALLDQQEVVLKPSSPLVQGLPHFQGATILNSGVMCTVLKPADLLAAVPRASLPGAVGVVGAGPGSQTRRRKLILLAEDSITTRAQEVRILEGAGYDVVAATDGQDAYAKLGTRPFDALVSDINMPRMDGLELASKVRAVAQYADLPIILVTSLASDEDKRRGLEIGANAYITKPEFDQSILLDCLERLVG